jgi:hypothetical protein
MHQIGRLLIPPDKQYVLGDILSESLYFQIDALFQYVLHKVINRHHQLSDSEGED